MHIVIALGGKALLERGRAMTEESQRANIQIAAAAIAPLAEMPDVVITHGNGPQMGLLSLRALDSEQVDPHSLDVPGPDDDRARSEMVAGETGWTMKPDGDKWRRIVPSPAPRRGFEIRLIRGLPAIGALNEIGGIVDGSNGTNSLPG